MPRLVRADRTSLLLGTALASTLLFGTLTAPTPAGAQVTCPPGTFPPPGPIEIIDPGDSIDCVNIFDRNNGAEDEVIELQTNGANEFITLDNSGTLTATAAGFALGIDALNIGPTSPITIVNSGDIQLVTGFGADGINASTFGFESPIFITNSGDIQVVTGVNAAIGIDAGTGNDDSPVFITNSGDIRATSATGFGADGIAARTDYDGSRIEIGNSGKIWVTATDGAARGIDARTDGDFSLISITNSGDIWATGAFAVGIDAEIEGDNSPISILNSGDIWATATDDDAFGIRADTSYANSPVTIVNSGDLSVSAVGNGIGISSGAGFSGPDIASPISITNSGDLTVTAGSFASGINAVTNFDDGPVTVINSGKIHAVGTDGAVGIRAAAGAYPSANSPVSITNSGDIWANSSGNAIGISALSSGTNKPVTVWNSGAITAKAGAGSIGRGILAGTNGTDSPLTIVNSGDITAFGSGGIGIRGASYGNGSPILIQNSASVYGDLAGILVQAYGNRRATIVNSGDVTAGTLLAIQGYGPAGITIFNSGTITGFVRLDADDRFINQPGGVFEARQTSDFDAYGAGGGNDLFRNLSGATVHTAGNPNAAETTRFINLERFENSGLISTVDKGTGDRFILSNTVGGTDHNFVASSGSTVALDTFLDGPGAPTDTFIIEGNVFGQTTVRIKNTSPGPGTFNPQGIPVIFVEGNTPNPNAFQLDQPVDTGFFDYDLFFVPTNSGFWELRSFPGGGAYLLPQLVTAAQDIWHQGSSTWFDRTADLRVLLNGGIAPAYDPGGKDLGAAAPYSLTPAVWARASGSWLDRDDSETATAYGRSYTFDLDRDLDTLDFQMGLDLGKRDVWSPGDALVFGLLGGFVHADLDYDTLIRSFDFDGGQVGAYATYLRGGLFVDTLLNAHIYELDANGTRGFPSSLDASTIGLRTDTGYRFGSFTGGPFWEPLATLEVTWADIDGFSLGGNTVSFDDDANVRGRLGVRAGTTTEVWQGTLMEPFVIGSLWGNFTDDNQATLVSTGRTFRFEDDLDDAWGEVSAGVNFFNVSQTTAVFAKADVTFGDDVTGVGGKAGLRVNW